VSRSPPSISRFVADRALSSHDLVVSTLGSEILGGKFPPGSKLPAEAELLARFRVSRTMMREATKTLAAKGLLVSKTRIGTKVRDSLHWNLFDADVLAWQVRIGLDADFGRSLSEIRHAIEPAAAALAADRRSAQSLKRLRSHVRDMGRPGHSRQSFAAVDLAFHIEVGAASGNPLMRSVASVIEAALFVAFMYSSPVDDPKQQAASQRAHGAIVDAIEARDPKAAARTMLKVIDTGARRIEAMRPKRRRRHR
jgi:DNA-binding FadR family transcriptional regulator